MKETSGPTESSRLTVSTHQRSGKLTEPLTRDRRRWWIVWTLFGSTAINYISRQTLSVLAPVISQEFHLSHSGLSQVFGAFQISYAAMWLVGGIFLDVVGTRLGLSLAVIWWSAISALTSFVHSAS